MHTQIDSRGIPPSRALLGTPQRRRPAAASPWLPRWWEDTCHPGYSAPPACCVLLALPSAACLRRNSQIQALRRNLSNCRCEQQPLPCHSITSIFPQALMSHALHGVSRNIRVLLCDLHMLNAVISSSGGFTCECCSWPGVFCGHSRCHEALRTPEGASWGCIQFCHCHSLPACRCGSILWRLVHISSRNAVVQQLLRVLRSTLWLERLEIRITASSPAASTYTLYTGGTCRRKFALLGKDLVRS